MDIKARYEQLALLYAEKYGIVSYKLINFKMIYYENFKMEKITYKCIVDLKTMLEKRIELKKYHKSIN